MGAQTPAVHGASLRKHSTHANSSQRRTRAHRGMRAPGADIRRRHHRQESRRARRQSYRRLGSASIPPHEQRLASLLAQNSQTHNNSLINIRPKNSVEKVKPFSILFIVHYNIEGLKVIGRLHELCTLMAARGWRIAILSETKCEGSSFFKSGDYWVLQSGQVAFVLHRDLAESMVSFIPFHDRVAAIQLKITGGLLSIIGVYLPYESHDNESERVDAYGALEELHVRCQRAGPTLAGGDFNTKVQFRRTSEVDHFGPHLFSPLAHASAPISDNDDPPAMLPATRGVHILNRDLLSQYCAVTSTVVKNTYLQKSQLQKVTFYDKGSTRPHSDVDYAVHRELDHTVVSKDYSWMIQDVRSRRFEQVGRTTHLFQEIVLKAPYFYRARAPPRAQLPPYVWRDPNIRGEIHARIIHELSTALNKHTSHAHLYEPSNARPPPPAAVLDVMTQRGELYLEIYMDGSHDPKPSWNGPFLAGWAFVVVANLPMDIGFGCIVLGGGYRVFSRWGPVITDQQNQLWIGALKHSNNTGELSAFAEALLWLHMEAPAAIRTAPITFRWDSTLSGKQTSGDWDIKPGSVNHQLAENNNTLWRCLFPDEYPVFSSWVRGHSDHPCNDFVDEKAEQGTFGNQGPSVRQHTLQQSLPFFQQLLSAPRANSVHSIDDSSDNLYSCLCEAHTSIVASVQKSLPRAQPKRPWVGVDCLKLVDARTAALTMGDNTRAEEITRELKRKCRKAKSEFLKTEVVENGWKGIQKLKPFSAAQTRIKDPAGQVQPTAQRAQTFANFYRDKQWARATLPNLPPRPCIAPPAALCEDLFQPSELRTAARKLKRRKVAGTDDISNDFLIEFLATAVGFTVVLSIMNECFCRERLPDLFQVGRIATIYKGKGDVGLPVSYRPISLLQTLYKLYTKLLELRLGSAMASRVSKWQYGAQKGLSVDSAIFGILRLIEMSENFRDFPIYLLLLDWEKAYDRVHPDRLVVALSRLGMTPKYIRIIESLYANMRFVVQDAFGKSAEEPQHTGLRQGDPLSCLLFILLLSVIMHDAQTAWEEECRQLGLRWREVEDAVGRPYVTYVDDTNLAATVPRVVQIMLHAVQREALFYGLCLNVLKTFLIRIGGARHVRAPVIRDLGGHPVPVVDSERTLGFDLGPKVSTKSVVSKRGRTMLGRMNQYKIVWQSNLSIKKKVEKYTALVVNKGIWGLHLLPLTRSDVAHLEYIHARCLRRILKIKAAWWSRISNSEVLRKAKCAPILHHIRRKQLALLGHILRRPFDDPDRLSCFEPNTHLDPRRPPDCHRRVGAPRKTWFKTLEPLFSNNGIPKNTLHDLAQDRNGWFSLSERLCA